MMRVLRGQAGGKQGGENSGLLFAKIRDVMAEDSEKDEKMGVRFGELRFSSLKWVNDVVTIFNW